MSRRTLPPLPASVEVSTLAAASVEEQASEGSDNDREVWRRSSASEDSEPRKRVLEDDDSTQLHFQVNGVTPGGRALQSSAEDVDELAEWEQMCEFQDCESEYSSYRSSRKERRSSRTGTRRSENDQSDRHVSYKRISGGSCRSTQPSTQQRGTGSQDSARETRSDEYTECLSQERLTNDGITDGRLTADSHAGEFEDFASMDKCSNAPIVGGAVNLLRFLQPETTSPASSSKDHAHAKDKDEVVLTELEPQTYEWASPVPFPTSMPTWTRRSIKASTKGWKSSDAAKQSDRMTNRELRSDDFQAEDKSSGGYEMDKQSSKVRSHEDLSWAMKRTPCLRDTASPSDVTTADQTEYYTGVSDPPSSPADMDTPGTKSTDYKMMHFPPSSAEDDVAFSPPSHVPVSPTMPRSHPARPGVRQQFMQARLAAGSSTS